MGIDGLGMSMICRNMTVRRATHSDLQAINEVMRLSKGHWGYDAAFMDAFMEKFSVNEDYLAQNTVRVFCQESALIGFFSFIVHSDHTFELDLFFLHPKQIGKGIGKVMWQECCRVAKDLGAKEFTLWADPQSEPFYAKMGCEKIGVKKSPFMPDRYPPVMRYKLSSESICKNN